MWRNTYYDYKKSVMYIWENGKKPTEIEWAPYVYIKDKNGPVNTIDGGKASIKEFESYYDYSNFLKEDMDSLENKVRPEIQFLSDRFYSIDDEKIKAPILRIFNLDIEVHSDDGFPHPEEANNPIVLVSIYDSIDKKATTFGLKKYNGGDIEECKFDYIFCSTEKELLIKMFSFFREKSPEVVTGWNSTDFDLQYIINRSKKLFGDKELYKKMSPIDVVNTYSSHSFNVDIAGVSVLDYMDVYKRFTGNNLERYTLDFVSNYELEKGKIDYSVIAEDLRDLYYKDWDLYVKYNIIDAYRVHELEEKLGYIKLIQSLSLLCKAPMKYYNSMTQLIEGYILTYYRRHNMCAPRFEGGTQETFPEAVVKEPMVGKWDWVIDLDIVSSYPTAVVTLNMSNETYYGKILGYSEDEIIKFSIKNKFDSFIYVNKDGKEIEMKDELLDKFNKIVKKKLISIAPCGVLFNNSKPGILAEVTRELFAQRVDIKNRMLSLRKSGKTDGKMGELISQLHSHQTSIKIILNSLYGITAVPYSRYFSPDIAKSIVSCGRVTRAYGEKFVNEILNSNNKDLNTIIDKLKIEIGV